MLPRFRAPHEIGTGPSLISGFDRKMQTALGLFPLLAAFVAIVFRDKSVVRIACVSAIALVSTLSAGVLIAPHRLAEELLGRQPSAEWANGALAARDVVHTVTPLVASAIVSLTVLAVLPRSAHGRSPRS
jgi:hypothetical protein